MRKHIPVKSASVALVLLFAILLATGCTAGVYRAPVIPGHGLLYAEITAPLDPTVQKTRVATKSGSAMSMNVLGLVSRGDCSIQAAAKDGGITEIHHVDYKFRNILGVYAEFTTIVYGE